MDHSELLGSFKDQMKLPLVSQLSQLRPFSTSTCFFLFVSCAHLAAGWVNELWTMAVLETFVWFLTLLEVLLFVETLALVLATWFSVLFVLTSVVLSIVLIIFSVECLEEALLPSLVLFLLVLTSTLLDLVEVFD